MGSKIAVQLAMMVEASSLAVDTGVKGALGRRLKKMLWMLLVIFSLAPCSDTSWFPETSQELLH